MKNKYIFNAIIVLIVLVVTCNAATGQTNFKIGESRDNMMVLSGSTTSHDWTIKTKIVTGTAQFDLVPGNDINGLNSLEFSLPMLQLNNSKKILSKNLKANKFKYITYKLTKAKVTDEKEYVYQITTTGNLTIDGITKEVNIDMYCFANKNGSMTCTGKYTLKMTDYQVKNPSFMGGLMSTGETVLFDFSMRFER